jgi:hypothetical protein
MKAQDTGGEPGSERIVAPSDSRHDEKECEEQALDGKAEPEFHLSNLHITELLYRMNTYL